MTTKISEELFIRAQKVMPGGVNSPVRAFRSVGGIPRFIKSGTGSKITDVDGNEYIDYVGSWGPHLLGHNSDIIRHSLINALRNGTSFGAPTELEVEMAELIISLVPSVEMVRMVNSGTEATMSAIRLARGFTQKDKIIKFNGCYHGHGDSFLINAGSGALTFGTPTSPGITQGTASDTLSAKFNDIESVKEVVSANKNQIAAIIIEPVAGNMGLVPPKTNFLHELRYLCDENGIILIFDEVMTGFRLSSGGAQKLFGVKPDLTTFGKVIGGGLPVGAYGGRRDIMENISPLGKIYQAGTLSGNPLAMAAGFAVLNFIKANPNIYEMLELKSAALEHLMIEAMESFGLNFMINRIGSMMSLFFTNEEVYDYDSALKSDTKLYAAYFHEMLKRGIYLAPSQFETFFVSLAHSDDDIYLTGQAFKESLGSIL